uniref:Potassium/proton antiporter CemA n=1 Tax=Rotundella rotunda TaxID=1357779 RepID=A0A140GIN0_9CHLO|nr:chloroplast envelope membrane protein [Rotundella rotunda]
MNLKVMSFSQNEYNNFSESTDPNLTRVKDQNINSKKRQAVYKQRQNESTKQQVSITYEEIGLFPRSFNRVFDRFFKQLFFDVENLVIQEYRFYRYLFLTTVKCLFILVFVPLTVNFISKNYLVRPIAEYYWNTYQTEIFLNSYQQKKAFSEFKNFEEKIYFESLLVSDNLNPSKPFESQSLLLDSSISKVVKNNFEMETNQKNSISANSKAKISSTEKETLLSVDSNRFYNILTDSVQKRLQLKTFELATHYNEESVEAITNFFADLISFTTLWFLLYNLEIQINITKSFLLEVFFGLDDSKKSLLILFVTDLLVGYHSPNIWELFFQTIFDRYGLPESQTTIFLMVATLPVLLDVLFKYLIFRHLNRASPATVATYHAMIE